MDPNNSFFAEYLRERELADLLGVSLRTLRRWHERRCGPPRVKFGRLVLYRKQAVRDWLISHEEVILRRYEGHRRGLR